MKGFNLHLAYIGILSFAMFFAFPPFLPNVST